MSSQVLGRLAQDAQNRSVGRYLLGAREFQVPDPLWEDLSCLLIYEELPQISPWTSYCLLESLGILTTLVIIEATVDPAVGQSPFVTIWRRRSRLDWGTGYGLLKGVSLSSFPRGARNHLGQSLQYS